MNTVDHRHTIFLKVKPPTQGMESAMVGASSHVPVPPGPQLGIGRGTSLQQPPMGRNHRPAFRQLYPAQPANVPHPPQPFNFVQPHQAGPMIATRSLFQGSAGVQNQPGRLPYEQS